MDKAVNQKKFYYSSQGQQRGPVTSQELVQLAAGGKLLPTDLVWEEGKEKRVAAENVKGLFSTPGANATGHDPFVRDAFISFSSNDKLTADAICAVLEKDKVRCWIAPRDVLPGLNWAESIINGINCSRLLG